ncbi:MAG: YcdB/YcdC domain-containing protein [Peptoniphilaceae bacterium]
MKKFLTIFLMFSILFLPSLSYAEKVNKSEVSRIKKIFDIPKDVKSFKSSSDSYPDRGKNINYSWEYSKNNKNYSVNVTTDNQANIIRYDSYIDEKEENLKETKIRDKKEMLKIVDKFLYKLDPTIPNYYKLKDTEIYFKNNKAIFTYKKFVNEIEVLNDSIEVSLNLKNKSIENFNRNETSFKFEDKDFISPKNVLNKNEALDLILKDNPFYLSHMIISKDFETYKSMPVYIQLKDFKALDAVSKEFIDLNSNNYSMLKSEEDSFDENANNDNLLSEIEKNEIKNINGLHSLDEVKNFANDNFSLSKYTLDSTSLIKFIDTYYYNMNYISNTSENISLSIDAKNLTLISYEYSPANFEENKKILNKKDAITITENFIKKFNKKENIDLENPIIENTDLTTNVTFYRKEDEKPVIFNGIKVIINNNSKKIYSYKLEYNNLSFPDLKDFKKIENQRIKSKIEKNYSFKLYYAYVKNELKLIYSLADLNSKPIFDAKNFLSIDSNGYEISLEKADYKNLDKSKYKKEIEYLTSIGIILPKDIDLKNNILLADYIYLLNSIDDKIEYSNFRNNYYYPYYENLNIDDLNKEVNREDGVRWLLNSISYRDLYKINNNIFNKDVFKDSSSISEKYKAYYYLAQGLGIYDFKEAKTKDKLKVEEAMHLIYRLLYTL